MRGGVSGQYTAIAHLRMSDSLTGGDTRVEPHIPLRSNISRVTSVSPSGSVVVTGPPARTVDAERTTSFQHPKPIARRSSAGALSGDSGDDAGGLERLDAVPFPAELHEHGLGVLAEFRCPECREVRAAVEVDGGGDHPRGAAIGQRHLDEAARSNRLRIVEQFVSGQHRRPPNTFG